VKGINFQPVALTGRVAMEERRKLRFTLTDLIDRLRDQTGWVDEDDFFIVPSVASISKLVTQIQKVPKVAFTA